MKKFILPVTVSLTALCLSFSAARADEDLSGVWKSEDKLAPGKTSKVCMPWYDMVKSIDEKKDKETGGVSYAFLTQLKGGESYAMQTGETLEKAKEDKKHMVLRVLSGRRYAISMDDVMPMDETCSLDVTFRSKGEIAGDWKSAKGKGVATFKIKKGCKSLPPVFYKPLVKGCSVAILEKAYR